MEFMGIKREIRKIAELGMGAISIVTLILAGCGGGGGGGGSPVATTTTQITAFKGMFTTGVATVYDAAGTQITTGNIVSGVGSVTYPNTVAYPLVISVSGVYQNEANNYATEPTQFPLRGLIASSSVAASASGVPVTAITEMAVAQIEKTAGSLTAAHASNPITAANATTAISNVLTQFGFTANPVPSFNTDGTPKDGNTVALAGLGVALSSGGANLSTALNTLAAQWATPSSAVSAINTILPKLVSGISYVQQYGVSSTLPPTGAVPTPPTTATTPQPINVVTSTAATQIASATTLLSNLHTDFILQASGVQADLNNIISPFQEAQNFELFLSTGMTLASNGKSTGASAYVNGYPCKLLSLSGVARRSHHHWNGGLSVVWQLRKRNTDNSPVDHRGAEQHLGGGIHTHADRHLYMERHDCSKCFVVN